MSRRSPQHKSNIFFNQEEVVLPQSKIRNSPTYKSEIQQILGHDNLNSQQIQNQTMTNVRHKSPQGIPSKFQKQIKSLSPQQNFYLDQNDVLIKRTAHEKKMEDQQSRIFYEPTNSKFQQQVDKEFKIGSSTLVWYDPHIGNTRSPVNENYNVPAGYARQRKIQEFQTQGLPATSNDIENLKQQNDQLIKSNNDLNKDNNANIRKRNQRFSDMFGNELGYKEENELKQGRQRQLPFKVDWTNYDSLRNARDATTIEYQVIINKQYHKINKKNKSPNNNHLSPSKVQESLTEIHLRSLRQAAPYKDYKNPIEKQVAKNTLDKQNKWASYGIQENSNNMYSWKRNYTKKK